MTILNMKSKVISLALLGVTFQSAVAKADTFQKILKCDGAIVDVKEEYRRDLQLVIPSTQ